MRAGPLSAEPLSVLRDADGAPVPLKGVTARGRLEGLVFELAVEQVYRNDGGQNIEAQNIEAQNIEAQNIEAEYTFPVPPGAVLLGLELQIGERALEAVAIRRQRARENYERAIDKGDSAALLEQAGEGLWTLSLGNLLAGEEARIRYRYAQVLDRKGDQVRLAIPTVIAPRYGDPAAGGLAPHQAPVTDLTVDYPFGLTVEVRGTMAGAFLASPSHRVEVRDVEGGKVVTLAAGASLDRDFVLTASGPVTRSAALVALDRAPASAGADSASETNPGYVALVSVDPGLTEDAGAPLALKLVVDCSGSMAGTSIECARRALLATLDRLGPTDRVSLTRFGSTVDPATPGLVAAGPATLASLRRALRDLQADLGGTEMQAALKAAVAIPTGQAPVKDILLITDGEIWSVESLVEEVARSGHRLFVVAVGAAPVEHLARSLGERTGGACEFVSPGEDVEGAILRMFRRLRETPKRLAAVKWPEPPLWEAPWPTAVFSGDTLHLVAGFARRPVGEVQVTVDCGAPATRDLWVPLGEPVVAEEGEGAAASGMAALLPRLAAARRLPTLPDDEAAALAERYQLASEHTSFVVVKVRADGEKARELPALAKVRQMMAAGWGGVGRMVGSGVIEACESYSPEHLLRMSYSKTYRPQSQSLRAPLPHLTPAELLARFAPLGNQVTAITCTLQDLADTGLPWILVARLTAVARDTGLPESRVAALFVAILADSPAGNGLTDEERARLKGTLLADPTLRAARAQLRELLSRVTPEAWELPAPATVPVPDWVLRD